MSLWSFLYNEIYNNEKISPKKMMSKYWQFKEYEQTIEDCLSKGKKIPRRVSFERTDTIPTDTAPNCYLKKKTTMRKKIGTMHKKHKNHPNTNDTINCSTPLSMTTKGKNPNSPLKISKSNFSLSPENFKKP